MKFYAVAAGRKTGIFTNWPETQKLVQGFAGAKYKSFKTRKEAQAFMDDPVYGSKNRSKGSSKETSSSGPPKEYPEGTIVVHTDGGAIGNPGPGGYGVVIQNGAQFSGGFNRTTNNRMELLAVIVALESLQKEKAPIVLHSDSRYVINGLNKGWAKNWKRNNWKKSDGKMAINPDLWARLLDLLPNLDIRFQWVKGHAGDPLNEACDQLANSTARKEGLPDDTGYLNAMSDQNDCHI